MNAVTSSNLGTSARCLAVGLVLAVAVFLAPGTVRATNDCGAPSGVTFTGSCGNAAYTGIVYWDQLRAITLTVPGTATTTTITAGANGGVHNGITIRTNSHASQVNNIALTVGSTGAVAIEQSGTRANSWYNNRGILILQRTGNGSTTTVDVRSGVTIGTATTKMESRGIEITLDSTTATGAGDVTVTSAAAIYSEDDGIHVYTPGSGAVTVTNSGAIVTDKRGLRVWDAGSAGAVTVTNSGDITSASSLPDEGIFAKTTGKDSAGANAGVSVTHSAGAIAVAQGGAGIKAHVGENRQEADTGHADYVAPMNAGLAKVSVTGGSINAKGVAIEAINYEAGSAEVDVSAGVTLTSTHGHGIEAWLADVGNASGTITVTSAATIAAMDGTGIFVNRDAGSGVVTVANRGAIAASDDGIFATARGAGGAVSVTNSGALGTAGDEVERGILASHEGAGSVGSVTVTNSGAIAASAHGIFAKTIGKDAAGANAGVTVTHSAGAIASADGRGIKAHVGEERQEADTGHADYVAPMNAGLVKVEVTGGSIDSKWEPIEAFNYEAGSVEVRVASGVTLTSTHGHGISVWLADAGNASGTITVDNAGTIRAPRHGITFALEAGSGAMTVTNSGALEVDGSGIFVVARRAATGDITVTNSGAIGKENARTVRGIFVSHDGAGTTGAVTVTNRGNIAARDSGILAQTKFQDADGANDGVTVTHSAGAISVTEEAAVDSDKQGIVARVGNWRQETDAGHPDYVAPRNRGLVKVEVTGGSIAAKGSAVEGANYEAGSVEIGVSRGVTLSSTHEHGIEADLRDVGNAGGTIAITQAGTINAAGDGISARVARRNSGPALERPVIDIAWTGTFTALDSVRASVPGVARAVGAAQARQAVEGAEIRFAQVNAGIDAGVMKWQTFMRPVSEGDDPGVIADNAAQMNLLSETHPDSRRVEILKQFRSVLTGEALGEIPGADAIDADNDDTYSDAEIVAYLSEDDDGRRTLLRNVLAGSFTEHEMAVFRALIEGGDVEAALEAAPASYTDAWKERVRALLDNHNAGNVRIAMNGGSIDASRGDGIRAYYATPHANNGAISVTVAAGATVTGAVAGVYVANAGSAGTGADRILKQTVTVHGTVTGGTDAAVHLVGGGRLTVGKGARVLAGSSGRAILVNEPGRSEIEIHGLVRGARGGDAAVRLSGGGTVTIGLDGRVEANGAENAIQADEGVTEVTLRMEVDDLDMPYRDEASTAAARVEGRIVGVKDDEVVLLAVDSQGRTGMARRNVPLVNGRLDLSGFEKRPEEPGDGKDMLCDVASDDRCRLYEALPSMLLAMNGLPSYGERMAAARDGFGGWARIHVADGERKAKRQSAFDNQRSNVAFDYRRYGVQAGVDMAAGEDARFGVSVRGLQGSAEMAGSGGEVELSGIGAGLHGTAFLGDGFHVDAQAMATRYDVDLTSSMGTKLKEGARGTGYALALEAGRPMTVGGGVSLTPRVGLAWSRVSLSGFTDARGTPVSMKNAGDLTGSVGLSVETAPADGLRVFGSFEATHEFWDERTAKVQDKQLRTIEARKTGVRVGVGGAYAWEDGRYALRASAGYAARGSGNGEFDGGISFALRF